MPLMTCGEATPILEHPDAFRNEDFTVLRAKDHARTCKTCAKLVPKRPGPTQTKVEKVEKKTGRLALPRHEYFDI